MTESMRKTIEAIFLDICFSLLIGSVEGFAACAATSWLRARTLFVSRWMVCSRLRTSVVQLLGRVNAVLAGAWPV